MADTAGQADIQGLQIEKMLKGFADTEFSFKSICTVTSTSSDQIRWFQKTAGDLTATAPSTIAIDPGATPTYLEQSFTRNVSYVQPYKAEAFITMEDAKSAEIDLVPRTILELVRAVTKKVDTDIWNVLTESQSATNINEVVTTSVGGDQWDAASYAGDPAKDVLRAIRNIATNGYDISNVELWVSPTDYESLVAWTYAKGAQSPTLSNDLIQTGNLVKFAGARVRVNVNVTADYAAVIAPGAATFYQHTPLTSAEIEDKGVGTRYRVWEVGVAVLHDPKRVTLITDTQT